MLLICPEAERCTLGHVCFHAEPHEVAILPVVNEPCDQDVAVTCNKPACVAVESNGVFSEEAMAAAS